MDQLSTDRFASILYGGDYNPEQWPQEIWDEDVRLMQVAGMNVATLPVFGWGNIQIDEDTWDFSWLDEVIGKLHGAGIGLCLATATAATPNWLDAKYPEVLVTGQDGVKRKHGGRHTFCPNSPQFRRLSAQLARKMAERYGKHPGLLLWHISNEYGNTCYCDLCSAAFRVWLKHRYRSLTELNFRWNAAFWGQTFTDWSQIEAPVNHGQRSIPALLLDYDRFQSKSILDCCLNELAVLREITPGIPITTNMMGTFPPLNYHEWARHLDIVSWDSYPPRNCPPHQTAFRHSLMRGLKEGKPWMLMKQTPSQQNWQAFNSLKRPGQLRLGSLQAVAHGADAVMYFQWRRSPGGQEMLHGGVVEHAGSSDTRVFREVAALGEDLKKISPKAKGGRVESPVAVLFDWENWWAIRHSSGPSVSLDYVKVCNEVYGALFQMGISADVVSPDADLTHYKLVVAPVLKMVRQGWAERFEAFVQNGGVFLTTFFSGIVDESDRAFSNGYPGPIREMLGIWVEETDSLADDETNSVAFEGVRAVSVPCGLLCDRIRPEGARVLARYEREFYQGEPAVTVNPLGRGSAFYVGTNLDASGWRHVLRTACEEATIELPSGEWPAGLEATVRMSSNGTSLRYLLNHLGHPLEAPLPAGKYRDILTGATREGRLTLSAYGVAVLEPQ